MRASPRIVTDSQQPVGSLATLAVLPVIPTAVLSGPGLTTSGRWPLSFSGEAGADEQLVNSLVQWHLRATMSTVNTLLDKALVPDDGPIKGVLGTTWAFFEEVRAQTRSCEQDWKHYGNKYGWKLKIHADDKNLCEVTVADGWFLVAMAIREKERQDLASDKPLADLAGTGAKASEGYGIKVEVRDQASCERAKALLSFIMARRNLA